MIDEQRVGPGAAEGGRRASGDGPGVGRSGRMARQRKRDAVLRLLRGEDLETVSRTLGVTAATLTSWQEAFLAGGEASLATRPTNGEELERERLEAKIAILEGKRPLDRRKSRR